MATMTGRAGKSLTVAFLGPKASYTHQAALTSFPSLPSHNLSPQPTIEDVFASVQSCLVDRGVVPFENSTNGSVVYTLDLFADLPKRYPDIQVVGEVYVPVNHCLVGHIPPSIKATAVSGSGGNGPGTSSTAATLADFVRDRDEDDSPSSSGRATPGRATPTLIQPYPSPPHSHPLYPLSHIRKLYSHPQAWGQCNTFLSTYLKGIERIDVSSTSRAAQLVAEDKSGRSAAISSEIAAEVNGVEFLARRVQDEVGNCTRFLVLRKGGEAGFGTLGSPASAQEKEEKAEGEGEAQFGGDDLDRFKTLISFTVDHEDPGALAAALAVFKAYKLNLTSINARPSGIVPWNYIFIVEIKGRKLGGEEGKVNAALRDLGATTRGWRWLGSWENKLGR